MAGFEVSTDGRFSAVHRGRIDRDAPRPVDLFLDRERLRLTPGSRLFIERLAAAPMRLYQTLRVEPGIGIDARDLLARTTRFVHERPGTCQFVEGDLLAARFMVSGEGQTVIDGSAYLLAASDKLLLLKELVRIRRHLAKDGLDVDRLFDTHAALLFHHTWLARVALRSTPTVVGPDGEPLVLGKAVYRVLDPAGFRSWLATQPGVGPEPEGQAAWAWMPDQPSEEARVVATLKLGPKRMIVMTFARAALERTCEWLRQAPGGVLEELFTRTYDPRSEPLGPKH